VKRALFALGGAAVALGVVLLANTATYHTRQIPSEPAPAIALDTAAAAERLARALRFRTISFGGASGVDTTPFHDFQLYLQRTFPRLHAALTRERVGALSLLYRWAGSDTTLAPILLLAHQDVVPVEPGTEARWTEPPFGGSISDGYVWGRGALDDKDNLLGMLEAVEALVGQNFRPQRSVYLAFGADEEVGGTGAKAIAALLASRGIHPAFIVDEGGAIMRGLVRGVRGPVALVGIAEKGYISVELTVHAPGGHSSMPPAETAVGILSAAIQRLERHPMPAAIRGATAQMLDYVGPELAFPERLVVANRWLFGGLIAGRLGATPEGNAMLRTTTAPTMLQAGVKDNVLPSSAHGVVNFRILPGDTPDLVLAHVRATIRDPRVNVRRYESFLSQPSPVSDVGSPNFRLLERTIRQVAPDAIVVPWLVVGGTDARQYTGLTPDVYRFSAAGMGPGDLERVHGTNERLAVASYAQVVTFYLLLVRNAAAGS